MELTIERKHEIEIAINSLLNPYSTELCSFTLEDIRENLKLWKIGKSERLYPGVGAMVFKVLDSYVLAIEKSKEVTNQLIGHELGHIVLEHDIKRELILYGARLESLSGFQIFERTCISKRQNPFPKYGDSPQENAEAEYFSQFWNKRLQDINWLRETKIEDLDKNH